MLAWLFVSEDEREFELSAGRSSQPAGRFSTPAGRFSQVAGRISNVAVRGSILAGRILLFAVLSTRFAIDVTTVAGRILCSEVRLSLLAGNKKRPEVRIARLKSDTLDKRYFTFLNSSPFTWAYCGDWAPYRDFTYSLTSFWRSKMLSASS